MELRRARGFNEAAAEIAADYRSNPGHFRGLLRFNEAAAEIAADLVARTALRGWMLVLQ